MTPVMIIGGIVAYLAGVAVSFMAGLVVAQGFVTFNATRDADGEPKPPAHPPARSTARSTVRFGGVTVCACGRSWREIETDRPANEGGKG